MADTLNARPLHFLRVLELSSPSTIAAGRLACILNPRQWENFSNCRGREQRSRQYRPYGKEHGALCQQRLYPGAPLAIAAKRSGLR